MHRASFAATTLRPGSFLTGITLKLLVAKIGLSHAKINACVSRIKYWPQKRGIWKTLTTCQSSCFVASIPLIMVTNARFHALLTKPSYHWKNNPDIFKGLRVSVLIFFSKRIRKCNVKCQNYLDIFGSSSSRSYRTKKKLMSKRSPLS